jgi:hypothetical protein
VSAGAPELGNSTIHCVKGARLTQGEKATYRKRFTPTIRLRAAFHGCLHKLAPAMRCMIIFSHDYPVKFLLTAITTRKIPLIFAFFLISV